MITQAELQAVLDYDPLTGLFHWKQRVAQSIQIGDVAGSLADSGYMAIRIQDKLYYAHRLAWMFVHGEWVELLDHDDMDKSNNRISNLRPTSSAGNNQNCGVRRSNKSGYKGVSWHDRRGVWHANIMSNRKQTFLGSFSSPIQAAKAYDDAAIAQHGAFAKTNQSLGLLP